MMNDHDRAWNNFITNSDPFSPGIDSANRHAAIANQFMGGVNNGGINSFLTATPEISGQEVVDALGAVGAASAAEQLRSVLAGLGEPLGPSSAEARWAALDRLWTDKLDAFDVLSEDADTELLHALERYVDGEIAYYLTLDAGEPNGG